jgi:hypothetical protein
MPGEPYYPHQHDPFIVFTVGDFCPVRCHISSEFLSRRRTDLLQRRVDEGRLRQCLVSSDL